MNGVIKEDTSRDMKEALKEIEEIGRDVGAEPAGEKPDMGRRIEAIEKRVSMLDNRLSSVQQPKSAEDFSKRLEALNRKMEDNEKIMSLIGNKIEELASSGRSELQEDIKRSVEEMDRRAENVEKSISSIESRIEEHISAEQSEFRESINKNLENFSKRAEGAELRISGLSKEVENAFSDEKNVLEVYGKNAEKKIVSLEGRIKNLLSADHAEFLQELQKNISIMNKKTEDAMSASRAEIQNTLGNLKGWGENIEQRLSSVEGSQPTEEFRKSLEESKKRLENSEKAVSLLEGRIKEAASAMASELSDELQRNFETMKKWADETEKNISELEAGNEQKISSLSKGVEGITREMDFWKKENEMLKSTLEKNNGLIKKIFEAFGEEASK